MPSAAWIAAAKKTPNEPVFYAACESVEAVNVTQRLASDWNAGTSTNLETFELPGLEGGAGIRNAVHFQTMPQDTNGRLNGKITPVKRSYLHSISCQVLPPTEGAMWTQGKPVVVRVRLYKGNAWNGQPIYETVSETEAFTQTSGAIDMPFKTAVVLEPDKQYWVDAYQTGTGLPLAMNVEMIDFYNNIRIIGGILLNSANQFRYREIDGTLTTKAFDFGLVPNLNSRVLFDHLITGTSTLTYTAEGSSNNSTWTALGAVADGGELPPYRYYRLTASFHSTGYDTPELYSIRIVGGNTQYVYLGTHRNEPVVGAGEVLPYVQEISSVSSKIALKDKPTVGDLTMKLAWMPDTSEMVQSTGKRRSVQVFLGFKGLAKEDYEPYFTGMWESYTADPDKRFFTVKLRDVWKKFKKKVPEQQVKNGENVPISYLFGKPVDGNGTALNIIDAISQVADLAKAPDRYIDKATLATLKAAHFNSADWNVYRQLTEQKDSDELLKELAVTAGIFLVPATNGKLTPYHYDSIVAATPSVTLDAAQITFSNLVPDMAETVTRHNIFFNLVSDAQGRKLGGGDPSNYANVYTTVGSNASTVAERDREEVVVGEWFDNWGLAANATNGTPNPLTKLADRLESWYTPIATVNGKQVATTKVSVRAENVPLRYYADVMPGKTVLVDNLRLPCPASSWGGFSDKVKFLVLAWNVDPKRYTITLDLFQITPLTYTQTPTWSSYNQWGAFPAVTGLTVDEGSVIGVDGIVTPYVVVSFGMPSDFRATGYEVGYSAGGGEYVKYTTIPSGSSTATVTIPAVSNAGYTVTVTTINARGERQPAEDVASGFVFVTGAGGVITPNNTGLAVTNGTTAFSGRDCPLVWDATDLPASLFQGYKVEILSLADVVKRTVTVQDNHFIYTYGMNLDDFGTPAPSFKVRVTTMNANGSLPTPQTITVYNSVPAAPTSLTAMAQMMAISLTATYAQPEDLDCLEVYAAATNDRTAATMVKTTKTATVTHEVLAAADTRYYWIRVKDIYGQYSGYYPTSAIGGIQGNTLSDPSEVMKLLNADVTSQRNLDYLAGKISFFDALDTQPMAFQVGAVQQGAGAGYRAAILANDRQIQIQAEQIQLKASKGDLSAQVDILSDMIGLKLNATGTVSPGMAIGWTDSTHTRSNITFLTDTFLIAQPDGTGIKQTFEVGEINGVSTVGINGNLVIDGTIEARAIATEQLIVGTNIAMGPDATISWSKVTSAPTIPTNTNQLTDGAGLGQSAAWTSVNGKPTNLSSLSGSEAILNSLITLSGLGGMPLNPQTPTTIGPNWIYTGVLTAGQVNAVAIDAASISTGTLTGRTIQTADPGNRRFVVSSTNNQAEFWGDRGDGTISLLATIGINTPSGANTTVASFGLSSNATMDGVTAFANNEYNAGAFYAGASSGSSGAAVSAFTWNGYGGVFAGANGQLGNPKSPLRIAPCSLATAPTHAAYGGSLWVTSAGVLYINTTPYGQGEGTTWQKVGAQ